MYKRKNFIEAVPHFRTAYELARHSGISRMELSCLNNLIACMRMTGLSGCADVDALNNRALGIVSNLDFHAENLVSCVNAYVNAGTTHILRQEWRAAITILDVGNAIMSKSYRLELEPTSTARTEAALLQSTAQAHMGLFAAPHRGGGREDASIRHTILLCFQRILELPVPNSTKAHAHKGLAFYFERISRTQDLLSMLHHRRAAWEGVGMLPPAQCPICADEIAEDHINLTSLGCFHMFHRYVARTDRRQYRL
jgi:hypothetical protein